jgi:medium-chain acyl-[acyl-carrier-protein] hydrolase
MTMPPSLKAWNISARSDAQARLRLFCFPYAGGGASIFRTWTSAFPLEIEVCPIQLPGRENRLREPPFTQLSPLVQALADVFQPYLDLPFAFFGHSLGALISFELARQLRGRSAPLPIYLFVSGHAASQCSPSPQPVQTLSDAEFLTKLRSFNGTPETVLQHPELMEVLLPMLRADFGMVKAYIYSPEEPLPCPITAFGGLQDSLVSRDDLEAWRNQTSSGFTLHMFPGDHFFLRSARILLLQIIAESLLSYVRTG